jgi:ATP synthase protein I
MNDEQLKTQIEKQARRMKQAEHDQPTLIAQTVFLGTLGLILVLPIVIGAYIGHWLDSRLDYYSVRWTLSMIMLGVAIGALNVYFFIAERR